VKYHRISERLSNSDLVYVSLSSVNFVRFCMYARWIMIKSRWLEMYSIIISCRENKNEKKKKRRALDACFWADAVLRNWKHMGASLDVAWRGMARSGAAERRGATTVARPVARHPSNSTKRCFHLTFFFTKKTQGKIDEERSRGKFVVAYSDSLTLSSEQISGKLIRTLLWSK